MGSPSYRVILCRYNEIGLKSISYQKKITKILVDGIKSICKREGLTLQSALILPGRLFFFFPADQIPEALWIFRHFVGIQSLSPAISTIRKPHVLERKLVEFAAGTLKKGNTFQVHIRSVVHKSPALRQLTSTLQAGVVSGLAEKGISVYIARKRPDQKIEIEIREKGTYIYNFKIPTLWAGYPIETKRAALLPLWGLPYEALAAQLLLRRGAIVCPVWFDWGESEDSTLPILDTKDVSYSDAEQATENIARFYPVALPLITLHLERIGGYLQTHLPSPVSETDRPYYYFYAQVKIMETLILKSREKTPYYYGDRNLHLKGVITAFPMVERTAHNILQSCTSISLVPLAGLGESTRVCLTALSEVTQVLPSNLSIQDFKAKSGADLLDFQQILLDGLDDTTHSPIQPSGAPSDHLIDDLRSFFDLPESRELLKDCVAGHTVEYLDDSFYSTE